MSTPEKDAKKALGGAQATQDAVTPEGETRGRNRWLIAGGTLAGGALLAAALLWPSSANASPRRLTPPPPKRKPSGGGKGGGGGKGPGGADGPSIDPETLPTPEEDPTAPKPPPFDFTAPDGGGGGNDRPRPPVGPDPRREDLPDYYNDENPDPGKFYQVTAGGQDAKGLLNIARRWAITSLYLAASGPGGLSQADAIAWAQTHVPTGEALGTWADYILCASWNDVHYGSFRVAANNRRGPHGRGIDLVPQHADNWARILAGQETRRNVRLHSAQEDTGTPRNVGQGDRKLPLLWMPRLNDQALWLSKGEILRAAGSWADGSSFYFPPPIVNNRSVDDPTEAGLGAWGCGEGGLNYG